MTFIVNSAVQAKKRSSAHWEMRSGFPLFESWLGYDSHVLEEIVRTLGKLPESCWSTFERRCNAVTKVDRPGDYTFLDQVSEIEVGR